MRSEFHLVIPKTRTIRLGEGGGTLRQQRLGVDIQQQSIADVRAYMHDITVDDTQQQIDIGNPPQIVQVDGRTDKKIADIEKKSVVIFGNTLPKEAMQLVVR